MLKFTFLILLAMLPVTAHAESETSKRCLNTAFAFAQEQGGELWSEEATFDGTIYDQCKVLVPLINERGEKCHIRYMVNMEEWAVTSFEDVGCFDDKR